jgi:hypothetical protein
MSADHARTDALRRAASAKHAAAVARAEAGIRALAKTGQPVTFRAVASTGRVSVDFLYRNPDLRARIEQLRRQQPAPTRQEPRPDAAERATSNVAAVLTARLTELRHELAETKAQLAVAHGELLQLRRRPGAGQAPHRQLTDPVAATLTAPPRPRRGHVKDASSTS